MYDSNFLDILRNRITLSDVIGSSIEIKNQGRNKVACCPFHKEKTPSFHINDDKGFYHCFGCGAHGDVISFIMHNEGLSFRDAIKKLAEDNGIEIPKLNNKNIHDSTKIIYEINEKTCQFFEKNIINSKIAMNYINSRGISLENIKKFRIGYATNNFDSLIKHLKNLNFKEVDMEKAGVITFKEKYYDKFRNRIIFPVLDKVGKVIAFTGRVINKDDMPKYMNSPETPIYHKSSVLFNYFFAKKSIYETKKSFLVEGNLDALSMNINGIENVVAPMGTSITIEQIEELWKIADDIIVCLDGDIAGQKASLRLSKLILPILKPNKNIKFVSLPENIDPDDLIKNNGKSFFLDYIEKNILSLSEYLWHQTTKSIKNNKIINAEEKTEIELSLDEFIKCIKNNTVAKNFKDFFNRNMFLITKFNGKSINYKDITKIKYNYKKINKNDLLEENIKNIEKNILYILINDSTLINKIFECYNIDVVNIDFKDKKLKEIIDILINIYELNLDKKILLDKLENNGFNEYIIGSVRYDKNTLDEKIKILYILILERAINILQIEIKILSLNNNNEEKRKLMIIELEKLQNKKNKIEEELNFNNKKG